VSRPTVPGPFRRLLRERSRLVAVGLLAATALASSGLQAGAVAALRATLDSQWRGAYDILVTARDTVAPIEGMLPPNALGAAGGLSLDDVELVRRVDGVGIAAPIGEIAVPSLQFAQPNIAIPAALAGVTEQARAFRITVEYTTDDGLGERIVDTKVFDIAVEGSLPPASTDPDPECSVTGSSFNDFTIPDGDLYPAIEAWMCSSGRETGNGVYQSFGGDGWGYSGEVAPGILEFGISEAPQTVTRIVLIDPEAERELLGERADFLDELIALDPSPSTDVRVMDDWAAADGGPHGQDYLADQEEAAALGFGYPPEVVDELRRLYAANGADWDAEFESGFGAVYFPLLVADASPAALSARITFEDFGPVVRTEPDPETGMQMGTPYRLPESMTPEATGTFVGEAVADLSGVLNPFLEAVPGIAWPGADDAAVETLSDYSALSVMASARVATAPYEVTDDGIVLRAAGHREPAHPQANTGPPNYFDVRADAESLGVESVYNGFESPTSFTRGAIAVPIGSFSTEGLTADEDAASFVPLGAYQDVLATIIGGDHAGAELAPSVTGLGLVSPRTVAIGSLASVAEWSDGSPVSAIRVRVDGITGYSTESQERVVEVARAIEALGLRATIVAGSSPSPQQVRVLDYAFGSTDGEPQTVGELGTVEQNWSELGAAARAELSLDAATLAALAIALAAAVVLLGAVQIAGIPGRRAQSTALRELGFTSARTARWYLAEELPGLVGLGAVAALAVVLSGGSTLSLRTVGVATGAAVLLSVLSVVLGSRPGRPARVRRRRSNRRGVATVAAFGARQVVLHPFASVLHFAGIALVGLAGGALAGGLLRGREESGRSILARLLGDALLVPQLALGAVGVGAGIALVVLVRRVDLRRRAVQWQTLHAAGWTSGQLAVAQRVEGAVVVAPAVILAIAGAWGGATAFAPDVAAWIVATIAGLSAVATAGASLLAARERTRP
jgi:hypothetical protein